MIAHESRIAAARRLDALRSRVLSEADDGPPRSEALISDLCASPFHREDARRVDKRARTFYNTLKPQSDFQCWLVSQVGLLSTRIDRDVRIERRVREKIMIKADVTWETERKLDAIRLGQQLGNQPEEVVEMLRKTPQGCEWLMGRWSMLAYSADLQNGQWTPQQTEMAFDLLGTPALFRPGFQPGAMLDLEGRPVAGSDDPATVARRQIAELKELRDQIEGLDRANRSLAEADLGDESDPELKRVRRHEATLHSRLRWCVRQLQFESPHSEPLRGLWAGWVGDHESAPKIQAAPPLPEPKPETTPGVRFPNVHPPFDLELDELPADGGPANIPMILANRQEKAFRKDEARRDDRRREVEKLRA